MGKHGKSVLESSIPRRRCRRERIEVGEEGAVGCIGCVCARLTSMEAALKVPCRSGTVCGARRASEWRVLNLEFVVRKPLGALEGSVCGISVRASRALGEAHVRRSAVRFSKAVGP